MSCGSLDRVVRARELTSRLGVTRNTVHRWIKRGLFPAAQRLGPNSMGWRETEVAAWLATRPPAGSHPD